MCYEKEAVYIDLLGLNLWKEDNLYTKRHHYSQPQPLFKKQFL